MSLLNRQSCIAWLLIVLVSYTAFSVHVATHATGGQGNCELCTGNGNPAHAVPVSAFALQAPTGFTPQTEYLQSVQAAIPAVHYRQRAPPRIG